MTRNEKELIEMIRNHPNPEDAVIAAIGAIISCLNLLEPSESILSVDSGEFA